MAPWHIYGKRVGNMACAGRTLWHVPEAGEKSVPMSKEGGTPERNLNIQASLIFIQLKQNLNLSAPFSDKKFCIITTGNKDTSGPKE